MTTGEWEIPVTVAVPADPLPRGLLTLEILRDGIKLAEQLKPKAGDVTVEGVRLLEGTNIITAALRGPGGLGPLSDPVSVVLDRTVTPLTVNAPSDKLTTTDATVVVSGKSEPGASVAIRNPAKDWEDPKVIGPSGSFEVTVPLAMGKNRIAIVSTDDAGNERRISKLVTRKDGRPRLKLSAPKRIKASALPTTVKVQVVVNDANGRSIEDAEVVFAAAVPGQSSETNEEQTDEKGRVVWRLPISKGSGRGDLILVNVVVTAPNGFSREGLAQIEIT